MLFFTKRLALLLCVAAILSLQGVPLSYAESASPSESDDYTAEKMAVDLIAIRPMGIVSTIFGSTIYVLSLPFSLPGGNAASVWEWTVVKPAKFTFDRPLGDF